jgi:hypothetical protein
MTVEELLDRISSEELTEWYAYYTLRKEEEEWANRNRGAV